MATGGRETGVPTGAAGAGSEAAGAGPEAVVERVPGTAADYCGRRPPGTIPGPMSPNPEIFKAYDIRGVYGEDIDADVAYGIGRAFAQVIGEMEDKPVSELRLGLGRDMRLNAPELAERYRDGMMAEGAAVLDAGQVGTEMLYFLVGSRDLDGGLMCTASHNPKKYTGAKVVKRGAIALSGDQGIGDIKRKLDDELADPPGGGSCEHVDLFEEYQEAALKFIDRDAIKPLRVVVDGGNGMAGPMVGPLLHQLGLELEEAYWTPDGNFPDHEPNPLLPENREFIMGEVVKRKADLGIAWDGDADRCFFIDERGEFVDGDFLTALLAESMLEKNPGATILYDVRASRAVADTVKARGGTALMNRVGHAFFKTRMRKEGGVFGGEVSGHYYFHDFYNADSGTVPALLILELLSTRDATMSELLEPYRSKYFISGEINSEVSDQQAKIDELAQRYDDGRHSDLDGLSVDYEDWHFNVRPSNTEPLLRLCLESLRSREDMERRRDEVLSIIRS
jgi:phosphomannomutase